MIEGNPRRSGHILPVNADLSSFSPESCYVPKPPVRFSENFEEAMSFSNDQMQWFKAVEAGGFVVCPKEYQVHIPPRQHLSVEGNPVSDALYYIDNQYTSDGLVVWLSFLPPEKETSEAHSHADPEHYKILKGEATMTLGFDKTRIVRLDDYIRVPNGMGHHMKATEKGALTLLALENPRNLPPDKLHMRDHISIAA